MVQAFALKIGLTDEQYGEKATCRSCVDALVDTEAFDIQHRADVAKFKELRAVDRSATLPLDWLKGKLAHVACKVTHASAVWSASRKEGLAGCLALLTPPPAPLICRHHLKPSNPQSDIAVSLASLEILAQRFPLIDFKKFGLAACTEDACATEPPNEQACFGTAEPDAYAGTLAAWFTTAECKTVAEYENGEYWLVPRRKRCS
jgi:hypothetical protein